jgi:hypothetical protein
MAALRPIYSSNLFSLARQVDWQGQFSGISILTDQRDVTFSLGYVGDQTEKDCAMDFNEIFEFYGVVVKSWTNEDKTVLKAVAVFSKYAVPFNLSVEMKSTPPPGFINKKYIDALAGLDPLTETYDLLVQNPNEYPMVPEGEITKRLGSIRFPLENGLADLRKEITHRMTTPFLNDMY